MMRLLQAKLRSWKATTRRSSIATQVVHGRVFGDGWVTWGAGFMGVGLVLIAAEFFSGKGAFAAPAIYVMTGFVVLSMGLAGKRFN